MFQHLIGLILAWQEPELWGVLISGQILDQQAYISPILQLLFEAKTHELRVRVTVSHVGVLPMGNNDEVKLEQV